MISCKTYFDNANNAIEDSLDLGIDRGMISTCVLSQLRNLVEAIFFTFYEYDNNLEIEFSYHNIKNAIAYCQTKSKYKLLYKFHSFLQISSSHYTLDSNNSERLMLKYYEYLLDIKYYVFDNLGKEILRNIKKFPVNEDKTFCEYYKKIAEEVSKNSNLNSFNNLKERFYVEKVKPFFINGMVFYEVTLSPGRDNRSKFDRLIVFSKFKIVNNYAIKANFIETSISTVNLQIPIKIISNWMISIRPCEINNFSKYFNMNLEYKTETKELFETMKYLTEKNMNLFDIVMLSNEEYEDIFNYLHDIKNVGHTIFDILLKSRNLIQKNGAGSNILRYLLYTMKNKVIKSQYDNKLNVRLSNMSISYSAIPFDKMPFCTSLVGHNPKIMDLIECIPWEDRTYELLARNIICNTEKESMLYTPLDTLTDYKNLQELMIKYNDKIYYKHLGRKLVINNNHIYVSEYETNTIIILNKIISMADSGIDQYSNSVESWIKEYNKIDDIKKIEIIKKIFSNSKIATIYGSAGTGKTTLINYISNFFKDNKKLFLANTNAAVENLRNKVDAPNCIFRTVNKNCKKFQETDILIIDEASTVSNKDMKNILLNNQYKLLIFVGDIFQIESITFGNWFNLLKKFIPECCYELYKPFRTTDDNLLKLWDLVRNNDESIPEHIAKNDYSKKPDDTILNYSALDEIILCLNYDGLYGINNINRLIQNKNSNHAFQWGIWTYKVGDPVVFDESDRFPNTIYNNLKGVIKKIVLNAEKIYFEIEIDRAINAFNLDLGLFLIKTNNGKSIIGFNVIKAYNTDNDDYNKESSVPFQIAYAISIHKAQGLEYDSVKLIITSEIEERISHNIFYTAITRARKSLTIYWSAETQEKVLSSFKIKNINKDFGIIKNRMENS